MKNLLGYNNTRFCPFYRTGTKMPQKGKSSLSKKTKKATSVKKVRAEEDETQSQKRREKHREEVAKSREIETQEEKEARQGVQRAREQQKLQSMKEEDKKIQKKTSTSKKVHYSHKT